MWRIDQGARKKARNSHREIFETDEIKFTLKKRLAWPWKEKEVEKIHAIIEKHKSTFILAVTGDILGVSLDIQGHVIDIKDSVAEVADSIETMVSHQKTKDILDWLKYCDPSTNHEAARSKHEPSTGNWFIESKIFVNWTGNPNASLWLHGIPGAGKTVLCSTIIEHVKTICGNDTRYAYFYFDFNDPQKQTVVGMLRSIILQLCVGNAQLLGELCELYRQRNDGRQQPTLQGLTKSLLSLFVNNRRLYLILDALDECSERGKLLDIISQIVRAKDHANLFVTSRKEKDITDALQGIFGSQLDLRGDLIDADIDLHVRRCLESDRCLQKWNAQIKQEILEALVQGADGM